MARTEKVWQRFHEAFGHADRAFAAADEAFEAADQAFASSEVFNNMQAQPLEAGYHHLRFTGTSLPQRWRLFRRFVRLAFAALFKGRAELRLVNKKPKQ